MIISAWSFLRAARSTEETKTFLHDRFSAVFPGSASCYHINAFLMLASDDPQKFTRKRKLQNPLKKILFDFFGDA
jgi:hypothetical protein